MIGRKSIAWFLGIAFAISWPLFLVPLAFPDLKPVTAQLATQGLWALAMWGPGIAAIITTLLVDRQPFHSLHLNRLGSRRMYLWAWFLPPGLAMVGGLFSLLFGVAVFDPQFTLIKESLASASGAGDIPAALIVAIQAGLALTIAPFFNVLFALGEELGWRGYLLPRLLPLGQWKAILVSGVIWGIWHAPAIMQGLNYPGYPLAGILMMIVFCTLLGAILAWLTLKVNSPWIAALGHGSVNASAGLPVLFLKPGFNMALGGTLAAPTAWLGMALFIGWLVLTKRMPVQTEAQATAPVA